MANVIEQIVQPKNFGSQTIEMTVRSNERGPQGPKGDTGEAANVDAGSAYTIEYGKQPIVMNSGTPGNAVFDFYIPEGKPGAIHYYAGPGINITADNRIEATGEMAVYWGDLVGSMNNQTDLKNALNAKQNKLTAGANITISGDTISATDTTYNDFTGTDGVTAGVAGLVPAPATAKSTGVLKATGTWDTIATANISDNAVTTDKLASSAVTTAKLNNSAVTADKIAGEAVTAAKLDRSSVIDLFYPVGSYYETSDVNFNPNTAWGGTWVEDTKGRVTVGRADSGTFETVGSTGGEAAHTLVNNELPSISGSFSIHGQENGTEFYSPSGYATGDKVDGKYRSIESGASAVFSYANPGFAFGGDQPHNNLQPYIVVKRWHRTA